MHCIFPDDDGLRLASRTATCREVNPLLVAIAGLPHHPKEDISVSRKHLSCFELNGTVWLSSLPTDGFTMMRLFAVTSLFAHGVSPRDNISVVRCLRCFVENTVGN